MTLNDVMRRCSDENGTVHDLPIVLVDEKGGWTNLNIRKTDGRIELSVDASPVFTSDGHDTSTDVQVKVRDFLIERCKACMPYAPMVLPEVVAYLECEKSGDWSGWSETREEEQHEKGK